jgi:FAD/FMN-containing dehydrogenase
VDTATGRAVERRISRGDADFAAVVCSLGLLGVLTRVRFRLVDELYFSVVQKIVHLDDVLSDLNATSAKYDFWRVNWAPKSEKALLWAATAVPREKSKPDGDYPTDRSEQLLDVIFKVVDKLGDTGPLLTGVLEAVYDVMTLTYGTNRATGPLRNMLPVDRRAPLRVAMAEWSFRPTDVHRVLGECQGYFDDHGWPNIPTEIELSRVDGSHMSAWNWEGLPYIVKFNFMYLTEVCTEPGEKEAIYAHLRGLWQHLENAGVLFKAHWGKINFIDPDFVQRNHRFDAFRPLISPLFMNDYLRERIGSA